MYNYTKGRDFETCIVEFNQVLRELSELVASTSAQTLEMPTQAGKWSPKQILGHLTDSALNNLQRFLNVRFQDQPMPIVPYPQMELVSANAYQDQSVEGILNLLLALNEQIIHVVQSYTEAEKAYLVEVQTEGFVQTISWWLDDYIGHLEHHVNQIKSQIEKR